MQEQSGPAGAGSSHGHENLRPTFEQALADVKDNVLRLGAMVERAVERAALALVERDVELADQVRWEDAAVNELQRSINMEITSLIARQAPVARDVRELLALYHAAAELERMGDYATSIAKLAQQLASEPEMPVFRQIPKMEHLCREQLRAAMRALVDVSEEQARAVCARDDELDHLYHSVYEAADLMADGATRIEPARRPTCSSRPITWSGWATASPTSARTWSSWSPGASRT